MSERDPHSPTPSVVVVVIPAALGVFTTLAIILTIRVIGFAIIAGIGVFLVSFVLALVLDVLVLRGRGGK